MLEETVMETVRYATAGLFVLVALMSFGIAALFFSKQNGKSRLALVTVFLLVAFSNMVQGILVLVHLRYTCLLDMARIVNALFALGEAAGMGWLVWLLRKRGAK